MTEFEHKLKKIHLNTARNAFPAEIKRAIDLGMKDHVFDEKTIDEYIPTDADLQEKTEV